MRCELLKVQRVHFVSLARMEDFIDTEFAAFDTDGNKKMDFDEFYAFYKRWLNCDADYVLGQLATTASEAERCFLEGDANGDMGLDRAEIVAIMRTRTPPGLPAPEDGVLRKLADETIAQYDSDGDGLLQWEEFASAFNVMIERLGELHQALEAEALQRPGFSSVVSDAKLDDDDLEALEQAVRRRYEGETWVVRVGELTAGAGDGGMNVLHQARRCRKIPVLLKHPDQPFDNISQHYSNRSDVSMVDVQQLLLDTAQAGARLGPEGFATAVRDAIVAACQSGRICALRLGQAAPDFALTYNIRDVLPYDVFDAQLLAPGPLPESLHAMLDGVTTAGPPDGFQIAEGFQLVLISDFSMHTFRGHLRGKLPLGNLQPVQVCSGLSQVAAVLRRPREACPEDDIDGALAKMDAIADGL